MAHFLLHRGRYKKEKIQNVRVNKCYRGTRFDEISPLWQKLTSIWQIFGCPFLIRKNADTTLANL